LYGSECYDYASGAPISGQAGAGALCSPSGSVLEVAVFSGNFGADYYMGTADTDYSNVAVYAEASVTDLFRYVNAYSSPWANCNGSTSGYNEDEIICTAASSGQFE